ncbi:hypothetical protein EV182_006765, partial [Spiromyces aspiralis]
MAKDVNDTLADILVEYFEAHPDKASELLLPPPSSVSRSREAPAKILGKGDAAAAAAEQRDGQVMATSLKPQALQLLTEWMKVRKYRRDL